MTGSLGSSVFFETSRISTCVLEKHVARLATCESGCLGCDAIVIWNVQLTMNGLSLTLNRVVKANAVGVTVGTGVAVRWINSVSLDVQASAATTRTIKATHKRQPCLSCRPFGARGEAKSKSLL